MFNYKFICSRKIIVITAIISLVITFLPFTAEAAILEPSNTDKSLEYLATIFGNKINKYFTNQSYNTNFYLSNIFEIFNSFILIISIFVLGYVTVLSTVNTAQEGQVMGKKWSSVWIPLRSAIGLLLLSPMPGCGYSALQVAIMWIVLNGVGAADQIWNFVLNNLSQGVSISQTEIINKENLNTINYQSKELANDLFDSLICMKILNNQRDSNLPRLNQYTQYEPFKDEHDNTNIYNVLKFGIKDPTNTYQNNICGEIKITASLADPELVDHNHTQIYITPENKQALLHKIYQIKFSATQIMLHKINQFVELLIDSAIKTPSGEVIYPEEFKQPAILYHAIKEYQQAIAHLNKQDVMSWVNLPIQLDKQAISEKIIQQGKELGWITAGSYYYLFSQTPIKNLLTTARSPSTASDQLFKIQNAVNIDTNKLNRASLGIVSTKIEPYISALINQQQQIKNLFIEPKKLMITNQISNQIKAANHQQLNNLHEKLPTDFKDNAILNLQEIRNKIATKNPQIKPYMDSFFNLYETAIKEIELCFDTNTDPLISQAMFGTKLMQTAETFWTGITVSSLIFDTLTDFFTAAENQASMGFIVTLLPITLIFSAVIWGIGATFAVYTPMIPYMIFIITSLGWFMLVIEAIIAAPIIALGFITPSQDELGKVAPALGILANMCLKPSLMVLGLLIASKLYLTLINMINLGFKFTFATLQSQAGSSMFAWIIVIILYSGFLITLVNKCYGFIYQLPDKILRWIGLTGEQTDITSIKETQTLFDQGVKQGIAPVEGAATAAAKKFKLQLDAASQRAQAIASNATATSGDGSGLSY